MLNYPENPHRRNYVKRIVTAVALVIGLTIASSGAASAHREWRGGYGSGPGTVADVSGIPGLDLSADQTQRIAVLREAHRTDILPLQDRLMAKGRQLRELWLAKDPDRERIMALQREVHELRGLLLEKLAAYRLEVLQLLTPDQRTKVQAFEAERHKGRMGPGMGGGPFPGRPEGLPPGNPHRDRNPGPESKPGAEGNPGAGASSAPANR